MKKTNSATVDSAMAAGRGGAKAGMHPYGIFDGRKYGNTEIWPLLANWHLHCRMDSAEICIM